MMRTLSLLSTLLLLAASVTSFQPVPLRSLASKASSGRAALYGTSPDEGESETTGATEVTDLDKATFDIAKDYAKTGLPEDNADQFDPFTM